MHVFFKFLKAHDLVFLGDTLLFNIQKGWGKLANGKMKSLFQTWAIGRRKIGVKKFSLFVNYVAFRRQTFIH